MSDIGKMDKSTVERLINIGRKMPSLQWWYSPHVQLGCSPRDAIDAMRIDEVEQLLELGTKVPCRVND